MRGTVSLRTVNLVEQGDQIEEGKHLSLPQGVEDLVYARNRQLAEAATLVEFLVIHGELNASRLLPDDLQGARVRRGRVLDQAGRQVLVLGGLHLLAHNGIDAVRPGRDRSASFRDRNYERHQRAGTKIRLGLLLIENV